MSNSGLSTSLASGTGPEVSLDSAQISQPSLVQQSGNLSAGAHSKLLEPGVKDLLSDIALTNPNQVHAPYDLTLLIEEAKDRIRALSDLNAPEEILSEYRDNLRYAVEKINSSDDSLDNRFSFVVTLSVLRAETPQIGILGERVLLRPEEQSNLPFMIEDAVKGIDDLLKSFPWLRQSEEFKSGQQTIDRAVAEYDKLTLLLPRNIPVSLKLDAKVEHEALTAGYGVILLHQALSAKSAI